MWVDIVRRVGPYDRIDYQGQTKKVSFPAWQIAAWMICFPLAILGGFLSLTLPLTVIVEVFLATGYARVRKKEWGDLVTLVLIGNLITQAGLWIVLHKWSLSNYWGVLVVSEILIWLLEALLYYLPLRRETSLWEALGMSLFFNGVSFGLGILLPF